MDWKILAVVAPLLAIGCKKPPCVGKDCNEKIPYTNTLIVAPSSSLLVVQGGSATQQFKAYIRGEDVTPSTTWKIDQPSIGSISAQGLFTSNYPLPHGGNVGLSASYVSNFASARLTIDYFAPDVLDISAPMDAAMYFAGPTSGNPDEMPALVYPLDGTMMPRNLSQITLQWSGAKQHKVFHIHVSGATIDSNFYVGSGVCQETPDSLQCSYSPQDSTWSTVALSAAGQPVNITVAGTTGPGQPVAESSPVVVNFSPEDVKGGFYYFSPSINGLKRLPFGATEVTDFISQGGGYGCAGCHTVSRDGKKLAATFWGADGAGGMVDGANGKKFLIKPASSQGQPVRQWNFATFNPDASLLLTNWGGVLTLRDGNTGAKKTDIPESVTGGKAVMPEWSPDGKSVAFVQLSSSGKLGKDLAPNNLLAGDWILGNAGSIATMTYQGGSFSPAQVIVPATTQAEYHYFPTWSPDSKWILFVSAVWPGSSPTAEKNLGVPAKSYLLSYDQDTARLRLVQSSGQGAVIELGNATRMPNKTTSWPKFAPFIQSSGDLVFFTYSAKFDYGFAVTNGQTPQLWMSAINLRKAQSELGVSDPSYPPFWLPFQNPKEKNHSGIWTSDVACTMPSDCPSEFNCVNGTCVPVIPG